MDKVLLDTFVDYYNKGDRCQNGWKSHVYTAAVKNVCEKFNSPLQRKILALAARPLISTTISLMVCCPLVVLDGIGRRTSSKLIVTLYGMSMLR